MSRTYEVGSSVVIYNKTKLLCKGVVTSISRSYNSKNTIIRVSVTDSVKTIEFVQTPVADYSFRNDSWSNDVPFSFDKTPIFLFHSEEHWQELKQSEVIGNFILDLFNKPDMRGKLSLNSLIEIKNILANDLNQSEIKN